MASPMARLQQKKQAAVTTGLARSTGIPCAMVLTVSFALSSVTIAWLPPSPARRESVFTNLAPALERQDHTTSPSAQGHVRLTCHPRPSHPRPTCRADRPKRPSSSRRHAADHLLTLPVPQI